MAMVSENQSGNLNSSPLQCLQFPTMIVTENTVKKKIKIKIPRRRIEAEPVTESHEFGQRVFTNAECGYGDPVNEKNSKMINSHKLVIPASGDSQSYYASDTLKAKSCAMGSHKRKFQGVGDGKKEKRRKMDRTVTRQCSSILKQLMTHPAGWVFNQPVDPVKLDIPDYFTIISEPMDLGTIKTKLDTNSYSSAEEFAGDVRLTFSNAKVYNPPPNKIYEMAEKLNNIFNTRWKCFEAKWNPEHTNVEKGLISRGRAKTNTSNPGEKKSSLHVSLLPKMLMSTEEKQKLRKQLLEVSREKMSPHLQGILKKFGFNWPRAGRIELDIDAFDEETLLELKRIIRSSLGARATKVESAKKTENGSRQSLVKIVHRGADGGNGSASASNPPSNLVTPKCGSCGSIRCQCCLQSDSIRASSSGLSSERSLGQDRADASRKKPEVKSQSASQMSKSDPESDGAVSALDEEFLCSSSQLSTLATSAASGDGWTPLVDIQLSPKKALRAAMLKSRFADTIFKAKQKTLLDPVDKTDPVKMQKEKERLERQQHE
ncbi:hypothetical protein U1Q18_043554, partial [Sarracenia purpurea var. burkii]